ncbi:MAG: hypothetical protein KH420_09370 [Clostridiales bacterium]|nr:hypothetical protein [Clostridiales bacterium]
MKDRQSRGAVWINRALLIAMTVIFAAGLGKTLLAPDEIDYYENRYANQVARLSAASYLDASFQDSMEDALADQVQLSTTAKRLYNGAQAFLTQKGSELFLNEQGRYVKFGDSYTFDDVLVYPTRTLQTERQKLDARAEDLNDAFAAHPQTAFYLYYIEKDTDLNFETGEKSGLYDYLTGLLTLPDDHMACFRVDSFEAFCQNFYRTDHHWNNRGSYLGYTQVMALLGRTDVLEPIEEVDLGYTFSGSKAISAGATNVFTEPFTAYQFDFAPETITVNGQPAADYGAQAAYFAHQPETISYGMFYGGDEGEVIFDTGTTGRGSLLVLGESYDNAILKLLSESFDKTYSVDLRYYEAKMGQSFQLSAYLQAHDITTVLLIGNIDYFVMDEFSLRG